MCYDVWHRRGGGYLSDAIGAVRGVAGATKSNMEALRESFLNLTFQMSSYKRATLDEEDLVDSTSDDIYPSSPMQVNMHDVGL